MPIDREYVVVACNIRYRPQAERESLLLYISGIPTLSLPADQKISPLPHQIIYQLLYTLTTEI